MSELKIRRYPHPDLKNKAQPITTFDEHLQQTIGALFGALYSAHGWGLAATQVGLLSQIIVIDISPDQNQPMIFINPKIISRTGEVESEEDNLSFPGVYIRVKRALKIELEYCDEKGNVKTEGFEGLLACCLQQKVDSLQGKLLIDNLSELKRTRFLAKYNKMKASGHHHSHDHGHVHGPGCNHDHH